MECICLLLLNTTIKNFVGQTMYMLSSQHLTFSMACLLANNCITSHTMKKAHFNIQLHFFNKAIQTAESTPSLPACKPLFPHPEIHFFLHPHQNMIRTSYKALWLADEPHSSKICVKPLVSTAQPISTTWIRSTHHSILSGGFALFSWS